MLIIRLTRVGKKKQPQYRFIVSEKTRDPWGKALEILGSYDPRRSPSTVIIKQDRIEHWLGKGAQCSVTVWNLLVDQGIVKGEKRKATSLTAKRKAKLGKKAEEAAAKAAETKAAEAKAAEEAKAAAEAPAEASAEEAPQEAEVEKTEEPKTEEAPAEPAAE